MRKQGTALREAQSDASTLLQAQGSARADIVKPPIPAFAPVPRKYRHDGWTPERQRAFIEALADCGSVTRAAAMVNMAQANCYTLRRAPGAEAVRRARDPEEGEKRGGRGVNFVNLLTRGAGPGGPAPATSAGLSPARRVHFVNQLPRRGAPAGAICDNCGVAEPGGKSDSPRP
jgi:hypothetical protein